MAMQKAASPAPPPRHAWSTDAQSCALPGSRTEITHCSDENDGILGVVGGAGGGFPGSSTITPTIVSLMEAEDIVRSLEPVDSVERIGDTQFLDMYAVRMERLSLQAHATAAEGTGADEYVVELLLTHGKLPTVIRTLLAVEAWRTFVLTPTDDDGGGTNLMSSLADNGNVLRCAFTLHVETSIVGLINLALYRREGCEALDGESAVALVDYCARCMTSLAVPLEQNEMVRRQKEPSTPPDDVTHRLDAKSPRDEMRDTLLDSEYRTCVAATTTARYLCEHIDALSLSVQTRLLDTHDYLVLMVPLVDEPPWTRRRRRRGGQGGTVWEKLVDDRWVTVDPSDLLRVTKCEAQCWLAIYHLTCNDVCRERYGLNVFRKEQLLRLRRYLHEVTLDQIPVLADVMRYMDELSLMNVPETSSGHGSALLMQEVAVMRDTIVAGRDWRGIAEAQYAEVFSNVTDATDEVLRRISDVYSLDGAEGVVLGGGGGFAGTAAATSTDASSGEDEPSASRTVESVSLRFVRGGVVEATYVLTIEGEPTTAETPSGTFHRYKMSVSPVGAGSGESSSRRPDLCKAEAIADVSFSGLPPSAMTLTCDNLNLPTPNVESRDGGKGNGGGKEWRQVGSINDGMVLQLGFLSASTSYTLDQAFLSQASN